MWGSEITAIIIDVAHRIGARDSSDDPLMRITCEIGLDMIDRRFDDFFFVTEHPTPGATYHVSLSFRTDQFRLDLTAATLERMRRSGLTSGE